MGNRRRILHSVSPCGEMDGGEEGREEGRKDLDLRTALFGCGFAERLGSGTMASKYCEQWRCLRIKSVSVCAATV